MHMHSWASRLRDAWIWREAHLRMHIPTVPNDILTDLADSEIV